MPIVMSKAEWTRLGRWADHDKEDPETARRREYFMHMDAVSREMTKTWPNSVENVNKRSEELRRSRIEAAERANTNFYKRYVRRKKEEQQRLMYSARDVIFKNKDAPKLLLSAVIESATLKEREEQIKFHNELRRQENERKREEEDRIISNAKEWHDLMAKKKQLRFETDKKYEKDILDQAHEVAERKRLEHETELNRQKIDKIKADEQMEQIKKFEDDYKAAEKARIWRDMEQASKEHKERKRQQAATDLMDDKLLDVLLKSRCRIENKRKQTEKEIRDEKLRILDAISKKLESGDAARDAKEQANLNKAIEEQIKVEQARHQRDLDKLASFRQQRREQRQQFLRDEARRLHERGTLRTWELMNRFKNEELNEEFKEHLRQEKSRKINEYREDMLRLWKERDDREARSRAETRYFYGELAESKLRAADNKLFTHADALLREARSHGRPERPIRRALDRYCKMYRLYPMPDLPSSLQEHYRGYSTVDRSQPDPTYKEPTPPPSDHGPDADDEPDINRTQQPATGRRDGLQLPCDVSAMMTGDNAVDYCPRVKKTNGLQKKAKAEENKLPPVKVKPCVNDTCRCELKGMI